MSTDPVTAPDMVNVIAATLAAHQPAGGHRDLRPRCTCGEWGGSELAMYTERTAHQARAVLAAIREAGTVEWGVEVDAKGVGALVRCRSEAEARQSVQRFTALEATVVSRFTGPWTAAEG